MKGVLSENGHSVHFLDTKTDITLDFFLYLYVWIK